MATRKFIYTFEEGNDSLLDKLGGKGAHLCEMTALGLPIPAGFIISTEACLEYFTLGSRLPKNLWENIVTHVHKLETKTGRNFGSAQKPLLISVRSGAKISMPGMMDTILNLGINAKVAKGFAKEVGEESAQDTLNRFKAMYCDVVGVKKAPLDPWVQLRGAVEAVFKSWNSPRAKFYREHQGIPHDLGTAVTVMAMVFGNLGKDSGTGVLFTRDPATGKHDTFGESCFGEFLENAQGEDVVAGTRTPQPISYLKDSLPLAYKELIGYGSKLENHYADMQDIEFTIQNGKLFILQTRSGKRTTLAEVKIAVDMVDEGKISKSVALGRINPDSLSDLMAPRLDGDPESTAIKDLFIAQGFGASPGVISGQMYFDADSAVAAVTRKESVILVRPETKPDDIHGIAASVGVLTSRGGVTSHAAVVTRGMGKPCIVGCESLDINALKEGEYISIDGTSGIVYSGKLSTSQTSIDEIPEAQKLLSWADSTKKLGVMANADNAQDAKSAIRMGAVGIGLCRTEHMFLSQDRLTAVRNLLTQTQDSSSKEYKKAISQVRKLQTQDFVEIFRVMENRPVVVRLLDAPLHEFLSEQENPESNPMLGHRGVRMGLTMPKLYEMQVEAIMTAACRVAKKYKTAPKPEIMIPLTVDVSELNALREQLFVASERVQKRIGVKIPFIFGTMIETPRAALVADELAKVSDFFSFGTNDLTQMTYGFSRDDAEGRFLRFYLENNILPHDPFAQIDEKGVGALIKSAIAKARKVNTNIEIGICGEHGGDPQSVRFCHEVGMDYVSCSPFRVPVARLSASQANIQE